MSQLRASNSIASFGEEARGENLKIFDAYTYLKHGLFTTINEFYFGNGYF